MTASTQTGQHAASLIDSASFLTRTAIAAGPLSLLLMFGPGLLVLSPYANAPVLVIGFLILLPIAIFVALSVVIAAGLPLWWICVRCGLHPAASRRNAILFGLLGGVIIALAELAGIAIRAGSIPASSIAADGYPVVWPKLAFDLACTVLIGAVSARFAWRPPRDEPTPPAP